MYKKVSSEDSIVDFVILKQIILFFGLYFLFEFSFSTFRNILGIQNKFIENWSLVMWTLFMISLVVTVIRFPSNVFKIIKLPKKKNLNFDISELKRRVLRFMDSECPYLNDKLTITELASNIGCTSNQLSHVLNHELSKSFYDFVNSYRVKHAERQLKNGDHHKLSIFGIAQASGFRSKASFYNFFKKEFDTTPKEYIKRNNL
ncbi:helix-turn-helix domain-containing protein [Ekhidna sp. To15]|uniref:helix-turn-helix domain-containing protein n=1 Tax=Ekhidna sp. To15 TaxID=3395267 RepID=UPI003F5229F1